MKEYLENRIVVLERDLQEAYKTCYVIYSDFDKIECIIDIEKIICRMNEVEMILKYYLEGSI